MHSSKFWTAIFTIPALVSSAHADDTTSGWSCRNVDLEISCADDGCVVAEGHTPMSVSVDATEISVCAYSGCWEGAPTVSMRSGAFDSFASAGLPFSTAPEDKADLSITVDTTSGVATILVAGLYAHPMLCVAR